jgi:hypothetical protein
MALLRFMGWEPGANTAHAIKAIRERAGIPLNEALALVNRVLGNETVDLSVTDYATAESLAATVRRHGLIVEVVDPSGDGQQ